MTSEPTRATALVDSERCTGHGLCYSSFPDLFLEDDRGHSRAYPDELSDADLLEVVHAADNCPEGAIRIELRGR